MHFRIYQPSPKLRDWVRYYWSLEGAVAYTHFGMASNCPEMVFHYQGNFDELNADGSRNGSFTAGLQAQSRYTKTFSTKSSFGIFGVYLYPQTIPHIFGYAAPELTNRMTDLQSLLANEGRILEEKIALAESHTNRAEILNIFFEQRLAKAEEPTLPVFGAIREIMNSRGLQSIKSCAAGYFLSERQFERQFKHFTGFAPKLFSRITRFHAALEYYGCIGKSLTDIAYESGYYDQSHFIHDFREFSGQHPGKYFSGHSGATAWRD